LGAGIAAATLAGKSSDSFGGATSEDFIDAHVHVFPGESGRYPLEPGVGKEQLPLPSFTPEQLFAHSRPCGVGRIVLIQFGLYGFDNSYILDAMHQHPNVFSVVGKVDPRDNPREKIRDLARRGGRGLRISGIGQGLNAWPQDEALSVMWKAAGEEGLAVCPLINPELLPAVDQMCRKFSGTTVVIDHFARIGVDGQFRREQLDQLCALARHKNVRVKVSAFYALGKKEPPYLDLSPMIRRLLDSFGPERLMWGSDSPFQVLGKHTYRDSIELLRTRLDYLSPHDRQWLLRNTAENTFFR
jgi:predicted TIM-barrel fold metal-dependent hydrolase